MPSCRIVLHRYNEFGPDSNTYAGARVPTSIVKRRHQLLRPCITNAAHVKSICRDKGQRVQEVREG